MWLLEKIYDWVSWFRAKKLVRQNSHILSDDFYDCHHLTAIEWNDGIFCIYCGRKLGDHVVAILKGNTEKVLEKWQRGFLK